MVNKSTIAETIRRNRLLWFGHVQGMEENTIPQNVLSVNLETARPKVDQEIDGKAK